VSRRVRYSCARGLASRGPRIQRSELRRLCPRPRLRAWLTSPRSRAADPSGACCAGNAPQRKPRRRHRAPARVAKRAKGIEPSRPAWKAGALPLSYARECATPAREPRPRASAPTSGPRPTQRPPEPRARRFARAAYRFRGPERVPDRGSQRSGQLVEPTRDGESRIRTCEGVSHQIYSLAHLATLESPRECRTTARSASTHLAEAVSGSRCRDGGGSPDTRRPPSRRNPPGLARSARRRDARRRTGLADSGLAEAQVRYPDFKERPDVAARGPSFTGPALQRLTPLHRGPRRLGARASESEVLEADAASEAGALPEAVDCEAGGLRSWRTRKREEPRSSVAARLRGVHARSPAADSAAARTRSVDAGRRPASSQRRMELAEGIEPTTTRLQGGGSTVELR
jgi:hypothetical protein